MQTHQISANHLNPSKKRVGRGGKRGTYSGHGGKGQTARSGRNFRPIVREVLKRYPKLRGYRNRPNKAKAQTISIEKLMAKFKAGAIVSPAALVKANLVSRLDGKLPVVKILGNQEIDKALNVRGCQVSQTAKELIMKAGGTIR